MREVIEKDRTIASVAASYDLVAQTAGNWVAKYRKDHATDQDRQKASESAEIAKLRAENRELRQENELGEKSSRLLREGTTVTERYELINREEGHYPISSMCQWSGVSRSGYYSWRDRPESIARVRRKELSIMIKDAFADSDGTYGYRRIQAYLERRGVRADGATIRSIMHDLGLEAAQPRAKVRTTVPAEDLDQRPDLMRRDFTADEPGRKWCGDITYISTWSGFVYLATVLDCCTKKVVGYAMADHMRTSLVCEAIDMAAKRCPVEKGVTVFHSDRGSQYTSQKFLDHLKTYGIRPSVGRTGVCWDNAWAESFNATLKNERVHRMVYPTRQKAINDIASWIELRYNHVRLHSALGYRTPNEIEQEFLDLTKAA